MKAFPQTILSLLFWLTVAHGVSAATFYFSSSAGDDSRSLIQAQNPLTPWRSIDKLNEIFPQLGPGDAVLFRRGEVFQGRIHINRSGSENAPIVIGAYGEGARPVISGLARVQQWTALGNGIYESNALPAGDKVNMVVVNGVNYAMGRFPNADAANGGYLNIHSVGSKSVTSSELTGATDWDGAELVVRSTHWTIERVPITAHSGTTINYGGSTLHAPKTGYGFFIRGHLQTLDQFGEWYYNPATRKIAVFFGNQAPGATTGVEVSVTDVLAEVKASNISLEGLSLEGANHYAVANFSHHVERLTIRDCSIQHSGIDALFLHGAYFTTIEDCSIRHSNNCAVNLHYCPNTTLRNNDIRNTGMQPGMGEDGEGTYTAVLSEAEGFVAEYNHILNTGYTALRFGNGDNLIRNNYIDTFCAVLDDGAGIYTYGSGGNMARRKVTGNIVLNGIGANAGTGALSEPAAEGIYLDDNSRDIEVSGNTVAWCASNGSFVHNAQNFVLKENTFFDNKVQFLLKSDGFGNSISNATLTDNIYFSKEVPQTVFDINSDANDIQTMGAFNRNYYVRPLYDELPLLVQYQNVDGVVLRRPFELTDWQSTFGHGADSKKSPVRVEAYSIVDLAPQNQIPNEGFHNDIIGVWCFSPYSDCDIDWESNSVLDGGALQIAGPSPSRIGMNCGALSREKQYIIRFSAAASKPSGMEVYFMEANSPWAIISSIVAVPLSTEKKDYEILISHPEDEPLGTIQFQFGNENTTYWLDNLKLYAADVRATDPDEHIRFEFNPENKNKTVSLNGRYVDAKNVVYSGDVVLPPYRSLVLIKDGDQPGDPGEEPDEDEDGVPDREDQCPGYSDSVDVDADGTPDGCDDCVEILESVCETGDCPVDGDPIQEDVYTAAERISSTGVVMTENSVVFMAGNRIELKPGFTVEPGGRFQAMIAGCEAAATSPAPGPMADDPVRQFQVMELEAKKKPSPEHNGAATTAQYQPLKGNEEMPWKIYPNPVNPRQQLLKVAFYTLQQEIKLSVADPLGRILKSLKMATEAGWNSLQLDVSDFPTGTYYLFQTNAPATKLKAWPFAVIRN